MMESFPNLWAEVSPRAGEILAGEGSDAEWRALLMAHSRRMLVGNGRLRQFPLDRLRRDRGEPSRVAGAAPAGGGGRYRPPPELPAPPSRGTELPAPPFRAIGGARHAVPAELPAPPFRAIGRGTACRARGVAGAAL